ncbi:bifunctional DNA primase/polymerase [Sphaerisporangium sp. TRM90804]|uniref:bifunctional DNA primase/polymerase n=1 Tax=Sphaerisporangium sp. TRM90804 TaxID=3031113 RepID=UPI00244757A8|nr:bifunctional DNA primase/polymerase [Sphaerisporangium sp. TRM90804]MDH2429343.1 bifunctional DNA primase/polymerase [Sphaerisporangium sp. TRM90804]
MSGIGAEGLGAASPHTINHATGIRITPDTPKIDAMLAYAAHGFKCFMLSASKVPLKNCDDCTEHHLTNEQREACECLTCHGFYSASADPERLREMGRRNPGGLVAIRTGAVSGLVVADIDTLDAHGADGITTAATLIKDGLLPRTAAARSGTGGWHLLFAHPGGWIKSGAHRLGPGVDIKGDGGYFVAAPSRHPRTGQPYRWLNDTVSLPLTPLHPRVAERLREKPAPAPSGRPVGLPHIRDRYVIAAVEGEVQRILDTAMVGGRNDALNRSSFVLGTLVGAGVLDQLDAETALRAAAEAVGLIAWTGERQVDATIRSGLTAGSRNPRRLQGAR